MPDRHDWLSWDEYQAVHQRRLRDFEHFIVSDQLQAILTTDSVEWDGVLHCADSIEIHVSKRRAVRRQGGRLMVRTTEYKYHVLQRSASQTRNLFRYDNIGHHGGPGYHHRHGFADDGAEIGPPQDVGAEGWPTLGEVIAEACRWWEERHAR